MPRKQENRVPKEKNELDIDTRKVVSDGEKLKGLVEHSGWVIARALLLKKAAQYMSIDAMEVQNSDATTILQIIASRKLIAKGLMEWLQEIEGQVEQYKGNVPIFEDLIQEHILRM